MRTTLDIDSPILDELKTLGKKRKKSLGSLVSELLAASLSQLKTIDVAQQKKSFNWTSRPMRARLNIEDKDALYATLDKEV